jgi:hypothetical protein|tara:strand:- start:244 stop:516 length:273 start_codon:yes stop_codon:yes gene_type:complete
MKRTAKWSRRSATREKKTRRAEKTERFYTGKRSCKKTGLYESEEEAVQAASEYNHRILFASMNAYFCQRHRYWHIGHYDKYGEYQRVINA